MTDEELHAAQPGGDFKFNLADTALKTNYRDVTVPNWIAADGRWGDVYNALQSARDGNFATATEKIVKALEAAREFGAQEEAEKCRGTSPVHGHELSGSEGYYEALRDRSKRTPLAFPNKGEQG